MDQRRKPDCWQDKRIADRKEAARKAETLRLETIRRQEEAERKLKEEEARMIEEARLAEEQRRAEEARLAEERRLAAAEEANQQQLAREAFKRDMVPLIAAAVVDDATSGAVRDVVALREKEREERAKVSRLDSDVFCSHLSQRKRLHVPEELKGEKKQLSKERSFVKRLSKRLKKKPEPKEPLVLIKARSLLR